MQPPGDHEMQDEEEFVLELEDDPFAEAAQTADGLAESRIERRVECADEKRVGNSHALE